MYTPLINYIADLYNVKVHLYADDTQLYVTFDLDSPDKMTDAIRDLEKCIAHISHWMLVNKLKLNEEKTEVVVLCHPNVKHKLQPCKIRVGKATITPSSSVKNLGVLFDKGMTMVDQVTSVCKSVNYQLQNIGRIRKYLTLDATEKLVHALITSRLDNNNVLLNGLPDTQLKRLNRLQNIAARIITRTRKFDPIDILEELHWLPIKYRISFKILLLVYKSLNGLAPRYLHDLLKPYIPSRSLRSEQQHLLVVPKCRLVTAGDRSFAVKGPKLWNALPVLLKTSPSLDIFKARLKTHLFCKAKEGAVI